MKKFFLLITSLMILFSSQPMAQERGTIEEAKALALKAAAFLKEAGPEVAFREFENPDGRFRDRDLYVFVQDLECTFFAHGLNPKLVGRNIWNLKNPNGRYACQDIMKATKAKGQAYTDYIFEDPHTGELAEKTTFSIEVDGYVIMVGAYRQ